MPAVLNLPGLAPAGAPYIDEVNIYKRVDAFSHVLLSTEPISAATFTDAAGVLNDEYHITLQSSTLGVESLPSNVYRVGTPWMQDMGVILALQTTSTVPSIDQVGIYRRRFGQPATIRLAAVALGTEWYSDPLGQPGDEYHTTFINSATLDESQPGPSIIADAESGTVVVTGMMRDIRNTAVLQGPGARDPLGAGPHMGVDLIWTKRQVAPAANGQTIGRTHYEVQVQAGGVWSVPLIPNDLILGLDSYYEFTFTDGEKYFKKVKATNGLAQTFALLEDVQPVDLR